MTALTSIRPRQTSLVSVLKDNQREAGHRKEDGQLPPPANEERHAERHRQHKPYESNPAREYLGCLASRLISSEKAAPRWLAGGNARGRTEPSGVAVVTITSPGPIAGPGGDWSKRRLVRHIKACLFDASAIPEIPGTGVLLPPRRVAVAGSAFAKYDVKQRRRSYQAHALSLPWRVPKLLAAPVEVSIGHQALVEPTADLLHWSSDLKAAACVR
jgi:hypothetical protein